MSLLNRTCSVSVGPPGQSGTLLSGIRCVFEINRDETSEPNEMRLEIYNLSPNSRTLFETVENRIVLNAGHLQTGERMVAVGDITSAFTEVVPPDVRTIVIAKDGGKAIRDKRANLSYRKGVSAKTIVDEVVSMFEVDGVETSVDLSGSFRSGFAFIGQARDAMDKLAARFNFSWSIQNNTLQLTEYRKPTNRSAVMISPVTGLIGSPSRTDNVRNSTTKGKEEAGVQLRCLMNPALLPADAVTVEAAAFQRANYRTVTLRHCGDTHGDDWYTELEAVTLA